MSCRAQRNNCIQRFQYQMADIFKTPKLLSGVYETMLLCYVVIPVALLGHVIETLPRWLYHCYFVNFLHAIKIKILLNEQYQHHQQNSEMVVKSISLQRMNLQLRLVLVHKLIVLQGLRLRYKAIILYKTSRQHYQAESMF